MQEFSISATHIVWNQLRSEDVPRGLTGHDETANGRRLGKSDPGPNFPWHDFVTRLREDDIPRITSLPATQDSRPQPPPRDPAAVAVDSSTDIWDAIQRIEQRLNAHDHALRDFPHIQTSPPR